MGKIIHLNNLLQMRNLHKTHTCRRLMVLWTRMMLKLMCWMRVRFKTHRDNFHRRGMEIIRQSYIRSLFLYTKKLLSFQTLASLSSTNWKRLLLQLQSQAKTAWKVLIVSWQAIVFIISFLLLRKSKEHQTVLPSQDSLASVRRVLLIQY